MVSPQLVLHANASQLAAAAAARLVTKLVDLQSFGRIPSVVLTGGTIGIEMLASINASPARDAIDWSRVDFYWGDERFVPADSPDRNEKQARQALLDHVPVNPDRVHAMASSDGKYGDDLDAAAAAYSDLVDHCNGFDITMLGLGPDGHVASVFPKNPGVYETRPAFGVRNSPKPPPLRISLSLPTIRTSDEVWIITAGSSKADAVALALGGAGEIAIPAAGATGIKRTLWMLDREAAVRLPSSVLRAPVS
ncbi:6-phosphogluconolactonase [Nakamurella antarctica]|uniref:6-phosphogluconolactonase n=1 Tax=Nakamurella antarctica TaxID=1902245 RepID=A0A3G8ZQF7_9ACTN|nr:6-phosphogluconolactonase [Nakamurella antarctica]AZI59490.1 6-phosphogluconolactonase [Nakamurella antarctica]